MKDFFQIETPYSSEEYKIMQQVVNQGIDSHLEGFTKSKFGKSPTWSNKFRWEVAYSELPILYRRLQELYEKTDNDDFYHFKTDIQDVVKKEQAENAPEPQAQIDPPQGSEPSAEPIAEVQVQEVQQTELERFVAMVSGGPMKENNSDSTMNQHGMNAKPANIQEGKERFESVLFLQGQEADEALEILTNNGPSAALEYLKRWHYRGEHEMESELANGSDDQTFEKDGYVMSWNLRLGYIGLQYDTQFEDIEVSEDAMAFRKIAGQRGKKGPLGRHAPHSQGAKGQ